MDILALQGATAFLLIGVLACAGAFARQLRRLAEEVRDDRGTRLERRIRARLRGEGFSDDEITAALHEPGQDPADR